MAQFLIVDDEKIIRKGISMMIARVLPGHTCLLAENGKIALELIESSSIDMIISDIKMPVMDGMELAQELSSRKYQIPFIFLTGFEDFKLVQQAIRYHVVDYLLKPLNTSDLKKVILANLDLHSPKRGGQIPYQTQTTLNKFEFDLNNALKSLKRENVTIVIDNALNIIENYSLVNQEIQRIANTYFIKHGIYGLDFSIYRKPLNEKHLTNMIIELLEQLKEKKQAASLIDVAKNYINKHINEPPTLIDVANRIHLNPNYFSDYFKEKTGETFSNYLTRLRMEKAKELLDNPSIKIKEVSIQVGYNDVRNFRKKFKSTVGLTPNEYRKKGLPSTEKTN